MPAADFRDFQAAQPALIAGRGASAGRLGTFNISALLSRIGCLSGLASRPLVGLSRA
jgi:hypothetical protein